MNQIAITLADLKTSETGIISEISASPLDTMHLMELGFVPGSPVTYLQNTPFGDPKIFRLRGTSIALRINDAKKVRLRS